MTALKLSENNSSYIQIALSNPVGGEFVNDATVTGRIDDASNNVIVPTFAMIYVTASDGLYRATAAPNAGIVDGKTYKVIINATGVSGLVGAWECLVKASKLCEC